MTENEAKRPKIAVIGGGRNAGRTLKAHIDLLEELEQYRAIGTVELFEILKEKAIPKEPICKSKGRKYENCDVVVCPNCNGRLKMKSKGAFCDKCGQALVWN